MRRKGRAVLLPLLLTLLLACLPAEAARAEFEPMIFIWNDLDSARMRERASAPLPYARPDAPRGGLLRLTASGTFDSFNCFGPRGLAAVWLRLTWEPLAVPDGYAEGGMRGLLAEGFEVAPDRSWVTVRLRPEARFQDGRPVTAEDVRFSFDALTREGSPAYRVYYAGVRGVEVLSPLEARFVFRENPARELPLIVMQLPVLPKHWWEGRSLAEPLGEPMPGSGPYRLASWEPGQSLVYERDPSWWGRDLPVSRGMYNFDTVRVDYYRSMDVAREAFLAGQADVYQERTMRSWVSAYDTPAVRDGRIVREEIVQDRPQGMSGIFLNTRREIFRDARVRRAVALCFDFEWINRALFHNACARSESFFSSSPLAARGHPEGRELALLEEFRDRLAPEVFGPLPVWPASDGSGSIRGRLPEIVRLFEAAGWRLERGRMVDAKGRPFRFSVIMVSPSMLRVLMPLRRNLERVGVTMDIDRLDQTRYVNRVRSFDFDAVMGSVRQSVNPGSEQRGFWGSAAAAAPGSRNYAGISDPAVDALTERLVAASSKDDQIAAARALDRVLRHGFYAVPGWYSPSIFCARWKDRVARPENGPREGLALWSWHTAVPAGDGTDAEGEAR
ncbi:MAG: extracellular solute-binding protein [Desulfovibrionaceae bacterium]|nr:extracellular solute-binding protein [Desulfovibrionaceae bacterium]